MDAAVILVLAGPILIPVALIVFVPLTIRAERERRRILRQWATQHGWTFADSSRASRSGGNDGGGFSADAAIVST